MAAVLLVVAAAWTYASSGAQYLARLRQQMRAGANELIFEPIGDVSIRDIPKALDLLQGRFTADPHYAGHAHWYPYATPLIVAAHMRGSGVGAADAYLDVSVALTAALVVGLGLYFYWQYRWLGVVAYAGVVAAGGFAFTQNLDTYPASTARVVLVAHLAVAGLALARASAAKSSERWAALLMLGVLQGVLSVWHGASLVVSAAASACVCAAILADALRARRAQRALPLVAFAVPAAALFGSLMLPQLVQYGRIEQSDSARLLLQGVFLRTGGAAPDYIRKLDLLPRDATLALMLAGASALLVEPRPGARARVAPVVIAYGVAFGLANLGFVLNDDRHATLAGIAKAVMVAPPHTFEAVANLLEPILGILGVAAIGTHGLALAARAGRRDPGAEPASAPALRSAWRTLSVVAPIIAMAAAVAWMAPRLGGPRANVVTRIPSDVADFVRAAASISGPDLTTYGASITWMNLGAFKPLVLKSDIHANPYAQPERVSASQALDAAVMRGDTDAILDIVQRFRIDYIAATPEVLSTDVFARLCRGAVVLALPGRGYELRRTDPHCATTQPDYEPASAQRRPVATHNLSAHMAAAWTVNGLAQAGAGFGYADFAEVAVSPGQVVRITAQTSTSGGDAACMTIGALLRTGPVRGSLSDIGEVFALDGTSPAALRFVVPPGVTAITPRLGFTAECLPVGRSVAIEAMDVAIAR